MHVLNQQQSQNTKHHGNGGGQGNDQKLKIFMEIAGKMDKNGDDAIEESELEYMYKFVANEYGYKATAGDMDYVNDLFMRIDVNGDNKVTKQEFMEAY